MNFKVFQVMVTNNMVHAFNRGELPEAYEAYRASICGDIKPALALDMYSLVAVIDGDNLDDVFEYGNIGPEEKINRLGPMHSVSVGDIIVDPQGKAFAVASVGFDEVEDFRGV